MITNHNMKLLFLVTFLSLLMELVLFYDFKSRYTQIYSTVTEWFTHGVFNPPANLRFTLTIKTTSLVGRPYSIHQHKLASQIIYLREEKGMTFPDIADWLNKNGYTTPRGKTFTNPHAHSIYTKFYKRQKRFGKTTNSQVSDISVRYNKSLTCNLYFLSEQR